MKDRSRIDGPSARIRLDQFAEALQQRASDSDTDLDTLFIAYVKERSLDLPTYVPSNSI